MTKTKTINNFAIFKEMSDQGKDISMAPLPDHLAGWKPHGKNDQNEVLEVLVPPGIGESIAIDKKKVGVLLIMDRKEYTDIVNRIKNE